MRLLPRFVARAFRPRVFDGVSYDGAAYRFARKARGYTYLPPEKPADWGTALAGLRTRPRFSILTPVYNVERRFLEAAVSSVVGQWYPDWELILVDDGSTDPDTRAGLDSIARLSPPQPHPEVLRNSVEGDRQGSRGRLEGSFEAADAAPQDEVDGGMPGASAPDPRIKVRFSEQNRGIAAATNAALAEASGDYVVFLDHDDALTPDCLYELARAIARTEADVVYSDEDKIDAEGRFSSPFFKPDWSPDALMSIMYTCHVTAMRRSLVEDVGGLREGYEGAQDYDLALRVTERTERIAHVPKVLYHWRTLPASLASAMTAKPYAHESVRRLKEDALTRRGIAGSVEAVASLPGQFRVNYAAVGEPLVSIVIPTRNNHALLAACIDSILTRSTYKHVEIAILDNGSDEPATRATLSKLATRDKVSVLSDSRPFNYSALNNFGAARTSGRILLFLNDDTEVESPDWLERMVGTAQRPHVGAVGARLHFPDGTIQHCGVVNLLDGPGHAFYRRAGDKPADFGRDTLDYDWLAVTGACLAVERQKFERVGGFDESLPVAYNDVELCLRLREAGLYSVVCQAARLIHHESASRGSDEADRETRERLLRDRRRLFSLHPRWFARDPFHNPNLQPNSGLFRPCPA